MKMQRSLPALALSGLLLFFASSRANSQVFTSGSSGKDGVFNPPTNIEINLGEAAASDDGFRNPGTGVFDAENFAIVFHYQSIDIPPNVTVTFINHPKNYPVIWLSQGDVSIRGTVNLSGKEGAVSSSALAHGGSGGPGAFPGGNGQSVGWPGASDGLGYGGGRAGHPTTYNTSTQDPAIVGHATLRDQPGGVQRPANGSPYGSNLLVPFTTGGSGGGGTVGNGVGGGGGGGALMIASTTRIAITAGGVLRSNGGYSHGGGVGSPGCFRLVAPTVSGNGVMDVGSLAGAGGIGIVRVDAIFKTGIAFQAPAAAYSIGANMIVFPEVVPKVAVTEIGGAGIPAGSTDAVIYNTTAGSPDLAPQIEVSVFDFPANTTAYLTVRVTPEFAPHVNYPLNISVGPAGTGTGTVIATMSANQLNRIDVWTRPPPPPAP
jgi:hypothetical protein